MNAYRIFDTRTIDPSKDFIVFIPKFLVNILLTMLPAYYDWQLETDYQREHYCNEH
jgi:hypothetical protein